MDAPAIAIERLTKSFGRFKLGPLDLTVPRGAIYGLIGPNGAGKTTTIDLIMGMGMPERGTITVLGLDHVRDEAKMKAQIGYVSPDLNYNAWGKVSRLVSFYRDFYPDWDDDYCTALMRRMNIGWDEKIAALSFGSRTKLALVLALSHRPRLLLLDEPTAGLDAVAKQDLFAELLDAVQDEDRTVLISSHGLSDIERFADHIGIIHNGNLLLEGTTTDLVARYRMATATNPTGTAPRVLNGLHVQHRDGDRWRMLIDTCEGIAEQLEAHGMTDLTLSPVTLEELFVGLVRQGQ
jgi:ABC-2 type transport system ATP-binding protein